MSNGHNGSRSHVVPINPVKQADWTAPGHRPRPINEPRSQAVASPTPLTAPVHQDTLLACPGCGSTVRLALISAGAAREAQPAAQTNLRPAAEPEPLPDFEESVREFKQELIARALRQNNGVMTHAAEALGLKYTTFVAMVHRLEMAKE